jgi:hypothetical protein
VRNKIKAAICVSSYRPKEPLTFQLKDLEMGKDLTIR